MECVKSDSHFEEAIRERSIHREWCEATVRNPVDMKKQPNGRMQYWGYVAKEDRYIRVVVEPDGETMHTAHWDRNFKRRMKRNG